jgi:drug/metabolite transporter (DMT)-like permease
MRSLAGSVSMLLTFYAMARLPVGTLLTLTNMFPLWVTLLAWPLLRERPSALFAVALVSSLAGVALIEAPEGSSIRPETVAALLASFATAIVMLGLHRLKMLDPLAIVVHFSAVATMACLAFALFSSRRLGTIDLQALGDPITLALLAGVGVCGSVGQISMTRAFALGSPQNISVVFLSQVLFALAFDWAIWARTLTATTLVGTALVLAPVAWLLARQVGSTLTEK